MLRLILKALLGYAIFTDFVQWFESNFTEFKFDQNTDEFES